MAARKIVKRKGASPKLFFDRLDGFDRDAILYVLNSLSDSEIKLLEKCYGEFFDSIDGYSILTNYEKQKITGIIKKIRLLLKDKGIEKNTNRPKKRIARRSYHGRRVKEACLTSDLVGDMFNRISYTSLSLEDEIHWIKKAKLALYNVVSDEEKKLFFEYYCDVTPGFKEKYDSATDSRKERLLASAIEDARVWYERFISNNQRLIRKIVSSYSKIPVEEGMQEGNIGMITAFKKFDVTFGNKFSTYATWWIRQSLSRYDIQGLDLIRIPVHAMEIFKSIIKYETAYYSLHHRYPTDEEIMEYFDYNEYYIAKYREYIAGYSNVLSLDSPISLEDEETTLSDFIPDDYEFTEEVDSDIVVSAFLKRFSELNIDSKHKEIFLLYNGFLDGTPHTLEYVGKKYGLTRERIRQINKKVIMKLKDDSSVMMFFDYDNLQKVDYSLREILISDNGIDSLTRKILYRKYVLGYDNNKIALEFGLSNEELFNILDAGLRILKTRYPSMVNDVQKTIKIKRK